MDVASDISHNDFFKINIEANEFVAICLWEWVAVHVGAKINRTLICTAACIGLFVHPIDAVEQVVVFLIVCIYHSLVLSHE